MSALPSPDLKFLMIGDEPPPNPARLQWGAYDFTTLVLLAAGGLGTLIALLLLN